MVQEVVADQYGEFMVQIHNNAWEYLIFVT